MMKNGLFEKLKERLQETFVFKHMEHHHVC